LSAQPPDEAQRGFQVIVSKERFKLPSGRELELDIVKHPGAAAIVPFISDTDVLLIRQYRHATRDTILEVPAGKIDPGESPHETADRELQEEVGQRAGRIEELGWIWTTPGFTDEKIYLYAGFDLAAADSRPEDDEIIEPFRISLDEALDLIWRGELTDAKSAMTLIHAARKLGRLV
jgi:ADP-ribose pyrophosphatase